MKIAFFTDNFLPQRDGVVTSVVNSAIELGKRGHQVMIVAPKPRKKPAIPFLTKNITVNFVKSVPALVYPEYRLGMPIAPKMFKSLRAFSPDVIHFHTPWIMGHCAHYAARNTDAVLAGTNHIYLTKDNAQSLCIFPGAKLLEKHIAGIGSLYIRAFFDPCDIRFAPSKILIKGLQKSGYRKKFEYLPNGISLTDVRKLSLSDRAKLKKKYGVKKRVVLHFGRLAKEKSVDDLLKAFALLRKKMDDVSLLIIGDGPMRTSLERLAKKLGIQGDVIFAGSMTHDALLSSGIIGLGDCFATASRTENQPMVVLEAMCHGLPIVGCTSAGMPDLVTKNGLLARPGNIRDFAKKLQIVLTDAQKVKAMAKASLADCKKFSIVKTTDILIAEYRRALEKKRSSLSLRSAKKKPNVKAKRRSSSQELRTGEETR